MAGGGPVAEGASGDESAACGGDLGDTSTAGLTLSPPNGQLSSPFAAGGGCCASSERPSGPARSWSASDPVAVAIAWTVANRFPPNDESSQVAMAPHASTTGYPRPPPNRIPAGCGPSPSRPLGAALAALPSLNLNSCEATLSLRLPEPRSAARLLTTLGGCLCQGRRRVLWLARPPQKESWPLSERP